MKCPECGEKVPYLVFGKCRDCLEEKDDQQAKREHKLDKETLELWT